jgi:hypothetical protein
MAEFLGRSNGSKVFRRHVDQIADLVLWCPLSMTVVVQRHLVSSFGERCLRLFDCRFFSPDKVVRRLDVGWSYRFETHTWMSSAVEVERCELSRGVYMVIVGKLGEGEQIVPIVLTFVDEEA